MTELPAAPGCAVLVHGLWGNPADWRWVRALLEAHQIRVLIPDLPSHRSPEAGVDADAEEVRRCVRECQAPVVLVGWSYGGTVIDVAGFGEPAVTRLIHVSSVPRPCEPAGFEPAWIDQEEHLIVLPDTTFVADNEWLLSQDVGPTLPGEVLQHLRRHPRRSASRRCFSDGQSAAAWESIRTTVILGRDDFIPERDREWIETHEVQWIDSDHFIIFRQPEIVSEAVLDALCAHA